MQWSESPLDRHLLFKELATPLFMGMGSKRSPDENKKRHNDGTGTTIETKSPAAGVGDGVISA